MVQDLERTRIRLENIEAVKPLLSALRTISMGSWQAARKQKASVQCFSRRLKGILASLLPHLPTDRHDQPSEPTVEGQSVTLIVVGSERGLCGQFNRGIVEHVGQYLYERTAAGERVELWALGARVIRLLERQGQLLARSSSLSVAALPSYRLAFELTRDGLMRYEAGQLDRVEVLFNVYQSGGGYEQRVDRLIPPQLFVGAQEAAQDSWPPPIIETDPKDLYSRIVEQLTAISLYECLLGSATAEHAARYQLMEDASQNAEGLIEVLTMEVRMARRQAITQEMQALVAGAGMLGSQSSV